LLTPCRETLSFDAPWRNDDSVAERSRLASNSSPTENLDRSSGIARPVTGQTLHVNILHVNILHVNILHVNIPSIDFPVSYCRGSREAKESVRPPIALFLPQNLCGGFEKLLCLCKELFENSPLLGERDWG